MTDYNNEDPLKYLTLEADDSGILLIDDLPEGPRTLGYLSWKTITQGVQKALLQEKFLIALAEIDKDLL